MPRIGHRPMYGLMPMLGAKQVEAIASGLSVPSGDLSISTTAPEKWITPSGVYFDEADPDYYNLGGLISGLSDAKVGSIVLRASVTTGATSEDWVLAATSGRWKLFYNASGFIQFIANDSTSVSTAAMNIRSSSTTGSLRDSTQHTIVMSWNTATDAAHLYIDGSSDLVKAAPTPMTDTPLTYATGLTDWSIGASTAGSSPFKGCLQAVAFSPTFIDWSSADRLNDVMVNYAGGDYRLKPPGTDGSNWFNGTAPVLCIIGNISDFPTDIGSGSSSFTVTSGGVSACP